MHVDYMLIVGDYFPGLRVICWGDTSDYTNLQAEGGDVLPSKEVLDTKVLEHSLTHRVAALSETCRLEIIDGFTSSALGEPHIYDAEEVDQLNLIGATTGAAPIGEMPDGYTVTYAVRPVAAGGRLPKTYKPHTYAQLRQVIADGIDFKLLRLQKFNDKRTFLMTHCDTLEKIHAVTWESVDVTPTV